MIENRPGGWPLHMAITDLVTEERRELAGTYRMLEPSRWGTENDQLRHLLFNDIRWQLLREQLFATGKRKGGSEAEHIESSFVREAIPNYREGSFTLGEEKYLGVYVHTTRPDLAALKAIRPDDSPNNKGDPPPAYDWPALYQEVVRFALRPDGFETRLALSAHLRAWCAKHWGQQPDESTFARQVAKICPPEIPER